MESPLNGKLKTERKGVGTLKITVHGLSSHAGLDHNNGVNAITGMINIITSVKNSNINGINFDVINGGSRSNVIPDLCEAEADLRFKTDDELNNIKKLIQSIKPLYERTKIDYEYNVRPPMIKTSKTVELFNNARKIVYDKLHINIEEVSVAGGSDGNFCSYYAPVLDRMAAAPIQITSLYTVNHCLKGHCFCIIFYPGYDIFITKECWISRSRC